MRYSRPTVCGCLLALCVAARPAVGQGLPYRVTIVDWDGSALARQHSAWKSLPGDREVLFCVEQWKTVPVSEQLERVVIERVRAAHVGGSNRIADVSTACLGAQGEPLPMFHTHADGNCQLSPTDLVTLVARRAPFEGVQCGARHFVWGFAWQVLAVATSVEQAALSKGVKRDPP